MWHKSGTLEIPSPWWRRSVIFVLIFGFAILIGLAANTYKDAPPIPGKVLGLSGEIIFTDKDILAGQQVFLKHGLMENGSIWGHGAYLGPDFSAEYLHTLSIDANEALAKEYYNRTWKELLPIEQNSVSAGVQRLLKQNRYDPVTQALIYTEPEVISFRQQIKKWASYFSLPTGNSGLYTKAIEDPNELKQVTAFFAWTAWVSSANRPGKSFSYTNNFPYDPAIGNTPTSSTVFWSALSLIMLLAATAMVLAVFGKFNFMGWKSAGEHVHPQMIPGIAFESQKSTMKYFAFAAILFLAQVLLGGATAHYRVDPGSFYGIELFRFLPGNLTRTWHLQLAILWIAIAYVAGGLFIAPSIGGGEPHAQARGTNLLFGAIVIVVLGSLLGELLGLKQFLGKFWFWFGDQGWEYLDLGRAWQILLVIGLLAWLALVLRAVLPALKDPEHREITSLFVYAAAAIPVFYLPAMFFGAASNFSVADMWRFWVIHLWVEGFLELFVTVMVATIFYKLGLVSSVTAIRIIYMDAILFLGGGIIGTGHHWYWTGQSNITMAFAAMFSAMEVVPLTLLTLEAWDFIKLTHGGCDICGMNISVPHKWTFYFLFATGFWNFVGAGIFGFLINLPIISYFEVGTILTPLHAHTALMGVFGMAAIGLMVFAMRQVLTDTQWRGIEKYVQVSFWGLNTGLALMALFSLFPGGLLQFLDVLENGYWHARGPEFLKQEIMQTIEWIRLPPDIVFILFGVIPLLLAVGFTWKMQLQNYRDQK